MEVEQPPIIHEVPRMVKNRVIEELDDNIEGLAPCNGNSMTALINGINGSNGHGHVGRSLSVGDSIPEEDEDELDLEELENTEAEISGAGQRKGHRSGSFASTGKIMIYFRLRPRERLSNIKLWQGNKNTNNLIHFRQQQIWWQ